MLPHKDKESGMGKVKLARPTIIIKNDESGKIDIKIASRKYTSVKAKRLSKID